MYTNGGSEFCVVLLVGTVLLKCNANDGIGGSRVNYVNCYVFSRRKVAGINMRPK